MGDEELMKAVAALIFLAGVFLTTYSLTVLLTGTALTLAVIAVVVIMLPIAWWLGGELVA